MGNERLNQLRSIGVLTLGVLSISTGAIFTRYAQSTGVGSIEIAAFRLLLAVLVLTPIILFRDRNSIQTLGRKTISICMLAGCFLAMHFATWITSLEYTSISSSVVLVTTTPLWVSLYALVRYRQRMEVKIALGLVLVIVGGIAVTAVEVCSFQSPGFTCSLTQIGKNPLLGNFLALFGSWMAAGYLITGKSIREKIALTPYVFLVYGTGAVLLVIFSISLHGSQIIQTPGPGWIWLILLAVIPQLIGHTSFNWSLKHFSTTLVSVIIQAEPIGSTILGIFLFHEVPTTFKWLGVIIILSGILVVSSNESHNQKLELDSNKTPA
jgi:drug/metabolite transporter (DMT)-like permease